MYCIPQSIFSTTAPIFLNCCTVSIVKINKAIFLFLAYTISLYPGRDVLFSKSPAYFGARNISAKSEKAEGLKGN